jgi:alkylation response protein AidB-like acyl-CoA dehydrogenase
MHDSAWLKDATPSGPVAWQRLAPGQVGRAGPLPALDAYLAEPSTIATLAALERAGAYPRAVLAGLQARGLAELLVPENATSLELSGLQSIMARRDGGLAITVGVNALALLPVYIAGTARQCEKVAARLRAGAFAAMLLTELGHGSNLLRNETSARADGGAYVVDGEKHLINGGTEHDLLVALLRTRPAATAGRFLAGMRDFTLFLIERDTSVHALPRWRTLPARSADISGVRFQRTRVPASAMIGSEGEGFAIIQKTLMMSHGGIGALASGAVSGALEIALAHARTRDIYGTPIVTLGAISEHLARMAALDTVVAAAAIKAAYAGNCFGPGASYFGAVAKYACCSLAEEAVGEGRRVMGARALLEDLPYARFVRDVTLYGVFDGTSHLMLDVLATQISRTARGTAAPTFETTRRMYATPPRRIADAARQGWRPYAPALAARCRDLAVTSGSSSAAALASMADGLTAVTAAARTGGRWGTDQALRFHAAAVLAELEALLAACELVLPECRAALCLSGHAADADIAAVEFAVAWLGWRIAFRLRDIAGMVGSAEARRAVAGVVPAEDRALARDRLGAMLAAGNCRIDGSPGRKVPG